MKELTKETFKDEIKEGNVIVDFYADWCGPCKMMAPKLEELEKEHPEITFMKFNAGLPENKDVATEYQIMGVPTFIVFENGFELVRFSGNISKKEFMNKVYGIE